MKHTLQNVYISGLINILYEEEANSCAHASRNSSQQLLYYTRYINTTNNSIFIGSCCYLKCMQMLGLNFKIPNCTDISKFPPVFLPILAFAHIIFYFLLYHFPTITRWFSIFQAPILPDCLVLIKIILFLQSKVWLFLFLISVFCTNHFRQHLNQFFSSLMLGNISTFWEFLSFYSRNSICKSIGPHLI